MLEIKNKLYQLITLKINGASYTINPKSAIIIKELSLKNLPEDLKQIDKNLISFKEINVDNEEKVIIKRKNKISTIKKETTSEEIINNVIEENNSEEKEIING